MPYFGHLSGRLFFNKISRKYKAETNYPLTAKVRAKTAKALIERKAFLQALVQMGRVALQEKQ